MSIYLNDQLVAFTQYPNGEACVPLVKAPERGRECRVRLHWESDQDLLNLALLRGLISQWGRGGLAYYRTTLFIDYMPYSRMDREQDGHCFSLRYVAEFVRRLGWETIHVVEPHSDQTLLELCNAKPVWATAKLTPIAMDWMGFNSKTDFLVLPDKGAYKRYLEMVPELEHNNVVVMQKKRDFETGKILGLELGSVTYHGSNKPAPSAKALIIDDLCSRGGTFVAAADVLRQQLGCAKVALLVTHMEPAGLQGDLRSKLDRVFFTDTITVPRPLPTNFELFRRDMWL